MKKIFSILLAFALLACANLPAMAETWSAGEFTLEAPEGLYQLTPDLTTDDPAWALAGVADAEAKLKDFSDMGVLVNFLSEDGKTSISVMKREADYAANIHNLTQLDSEQREKVLGDLVESKNEDLTVTKDWFEAGELVYYRIQLDMAGETPMHELLYGTIVNGYAVNVDIYGGEEEITPEQEAMMEELVRSIHFNEITEKPEADPVSLTGTLVLLVCLLLAIAVPLIYIPVKSKREKKAKAKLAEQLSEYHRTHGANEAGGEVLFLNDTDCTKEAIHNFSIYHAYIKNVGEIAFGVLMCAVMLITSFVMETEWWMKIIAVAVTVYYVYKLVSMSSTVEKVQRKVYGRGPSQTARYMFYPDVFRVSGIQSTSVIPYFQLTDVRRRGQYIYLYYGPENAYMVDQYGFTQGEFEDFARFIGEKVKKG